MSQATQMAQQLANRAGLAAQDGRVAIRAAVHEDMRSLQDQANHAEHLRGQAVINALQDMTEAGAAANQSLNPELRAPAAPLALTVLGANPEVAANYVKGRAAREGVPLPMQNQMGGNQIPVTQQAQMLDLASVYAGGHAPANG